MIKNYIKVFVGVFLFFKVYEENNHLSPSGFTVPLQQTPNQRRRFALFKAEWCFKPPDH